MCRRFRQKIAQMPGRNGQSFIGRAAGLQQFSQNADGLRGSVITLQFLQRLFQFSLVFVKRNFNYSRAGGSRAG